MRIGAGSGADLNAAVVALKYSASKERQFALFSADLSLTSQTSATQIVAGDSFTYTVQLRNFGPDDTGDVVFRDLPPAGVTFTSCPST